MKSPELLELTASEPLTLQEEYEMQRRSPPDCFVALTEGTEKWHQDEDSESPRYHLASPC